MSTILLSLTCRVPEEGEKKGTEKYFKKYGHTLPKFGKKQGHPQIQDTQQNSIRTYKKETTPMHATVKLLKPKGFQKPLTS